MIKNQFLVRNKTIMPSKGSGIAFQPIGITHEKLKKMDNFETHPQAMPKKETGTGFGVPPNNPQLIKNLQKLKVKKPKNISID